MHNKKEKPTFPRKSRLRCSHTSEVGKAQQIFRSTGRQERRMALGLEPLGFCTIRFIVFF